MHGRQSESIMNIIRYCLVRSSSGHRVKIFNDKALPGYMLPLGHVVRGRGRGRYLGGCCGDEARKLRPYLLHGDNRLSLPKKWRLLSNGSECQSFFSVLLILKMDQGVADILPLSLISWVASGDGEESTCEMLPTLP